MTLKNAVKCCLVSTIMCSLGCSFIEETPALSEAAVGGVSGAAIGSGIGAVIGQNSSVGAGQGALIGAAIGLPVGMALGVAYYNIALNMEVSDNQDRIDSNMQKIQVTQREIESIREQMTAETAGIDVDHDHFQYIYDGPALGQYNR